MLDGGIRVRLALLGRGNARAFPHERPPAATEGGVKAREATAGGRLALHAATTAMTSGAPTPRGVPVRSLEEHIDDVFGVVARGHSVKDAECGCKGDGRRSDIGMKLLRNSAIRPGVGDRVLRAA